MPYSMDPEENKKNAYSPSQQMQIQEQMIYKLAALDSAVNGGFRRLDEKFDRMQSELHDRFMELSSDITRVEAETKARFDLKRTRIDLLEKEQNRRVDEICKDLNKQITDLNSWRDRFVARVSAIGGGVVVLWTIFGDYLRQAIGTNV